MSATDTIAFKQAQAAYDHAAPNFDDEAFDMAIEQEIESTWQSSFAIKDVLENGALKLPLEICALLARHREVMASRGRKGSPLLPNDYKELADALVDALDKVIEKDAELTIERRINRR